MAVIQGARAALILDAIEGPNAEQCKMASKALDGDARYLVADMLENGEAAVRLETGELAEAVDVHYYGRRFDPKNGRGHIAFSAHGNAFFLVDWWVS
jgi:hypothetical protein